MPPQITSSNTQIKKTGTAVKMKVMLSPKS